MVKIYCKNTGTSKEFVEGAYLKDIASEFEFDKPYDILAALVNNVAQGLRFKVYPEDDERAKHAVTHFKVLERFGYVTVVQCRLETGRTHQIRVHMSHIGHPLFNDERYGGANIKKGTIYAKYRQFIQNCFELCPRQALHAKTLGFVHPSTKEIMRFDSKIPEDMESMIAKWRKYVSS